MQVNCYSVRDTLMAVYLLPFNARNDVEAKRQLIASMRDPSLASAPMVTNPADFELYCVAQFDDETGVMTGVSKPVLIASLAGLSAGTVSS